MFCLISLESLLLLHRFGLDCTRKQKLYTNFTIIVYMVGIMCPVHSIFRFLVKVTIKRKSQLSFLLFFNIFTLYSKENRQNSDFFIRKKKYFISIFSETMAPPSQTLYCVQKCLPPLEKSTNKYNIINLTIQSIVSKILR